MSISKKRERQLRRQKALIIPVLTGPRRDEGIEITAPTRVSPIIMLVPGDTSLAFKRFETSA